MAGAAEKSIRLDQVVPLVTLVLVRSGCDAENAEAVASTVAAAERDGAHSHGLFRLPGYVASLKSGKVNGRSRPKCSARAPAVLHVDGDGGYAPMAHRAMLQPAENMARAQGVAVVAITNTFHFSALWIEVEMLARRGLAVIACTSFKPAIPPAGGTEPLFGTNPIAFGWPRVGQEPMVFDQASSVMARGEVILAARSGKSLPDGVGIGPDGKPTNDANEVLKGALLPYGGYKGASLAMMVELLAGPLIGENLSLEAARDDVADGGPPRGGEFLLVLDPTRTRGDNAHLNHAELLFSEMTKQEGVRLPGDRRWANRRNNEQMEISIAANLVDILFPEGT